MTSFYLIGAAISSIILVILTSISQIRKTSKNLIPNPPGKTGWPIIGETLTFISNPRNFFVERMTRYSSEVFTTSVAGEKTIVFCGPKANKCLFSNEGKLVKFWLPASVRVVTSRPELNESNIMAKTSNLLWFKFLRVESIQRHVSAVDKVAKDHMTTHWESKEVVKAHELAKDYLLITALRVFLNYSASDKDELRELKTALSLAQEGLVSAPINIPGTAYNKAIIGSALLRKKIIEIIRKRKISMSKQGNNVGEDLLSMYMRDCSQNNTDSSDEELARQVIGLIFGGSSYTSTCIAFTIAYLADYPHVYDAVLKALWFTYSFVLVALSTNKEQQEITKSKESGEPLTWKDLQKMQYLWDVICESMRLKPPIIGTFRTVITDFTYAGFQILKGCKVFWSPYTTHMDPKYFKDPEKFDPSRFHKSPPEAYTFVPFGGGTRLCPGQDYVRLLIPTFIRHVVTNYKIVRVNPNEKIRFIPDPILTEGLPIYLYPHAK